MGRILLTFSAAGVIFLAGALIPHSHDGDTPAAATPHLQILLDRTPYV